MGVSRDFEFPPAERRYSHGGFKSQPPGSCGRASLGLERVTLTGLPARAHNGPPFPILESKNTGEPEYWRTEYWRTSGRVSFLFGRTPMSALAPLCAGRPGAGGDNSLWAEN